MRKRARTSLDATSIVNIWEREVGKISATNFAHRLITSKDFVLRFDLSRKLEKHTGCVNTVSFNPDGDILVSGSDDRLVILWNCETGDVKLSFHSGHKSNVFQAKFMPYTHDRIILTCAADGQVRYAQILENGEVDTKMLAKHQGRAYKLATEAGSPHTFYSCGGDGLVQHIDLRTEVATSLFTCQSIRDEVSKPRVSLNAMTIHTSNPNTIAVAGSDEYVRLYDTRKYKWNTSADFGQPTDFFCPQHLVGNEQVLIAGLAFSDQGELLASYNDEHIYLFSRDMSLGSDPLKSNSNARTDVKMGPQVYKGHRNCDTLKGVSFFGPKCEYVVSGSDCGGIFIWKTKGGELVRVMKADRHVVNCIKSHPNFTALASCGIEHDIKLWTPQEAFDRDVPLPGANKAILHTEGPETTRATASLPQDLILQLFPSQRQTDSEN